MKLFNKGWVNNSNMLTIRKKLAEQAATETSGKGGSSRTEGSRLTRKLSFRARLLSAEANELGEVIPSQFNTIMTL